MSNQSQGAVLAGQPVAVTAGSGITIDPDTGVISVNAASVTGLMKLNSASAYNAYQWPNTAGTNGQFLQTNGAGVLTWSDVKGFAVVTVNNSAPTPADIGELWFDCSTGTLNVYQNCVGTPSPNWFNVAQPGFPVLPGNTGATPGFVSGTGTQADPYDCTVTTTGSGSTVQIIQTVTVTGLTPFQYVPIVDLNAVTNGGRFSFTNNYADASSNLTFDILFTDNPPSGSGANYTAAIKIGYGSAYLEARVNTVSVLVVTGGSIAGPLYVGQQLTYTPGMPSGGQTPYGTPTYKWFANGVQIGGAAAATFTITSAQLGAQITASTTYTDSSSQTATGTSAAVGPVLAAPPALTITSPGSITPTSAVATTVLNYTAGTFTGGIPTVTPSWVWQKAGVNITGTENAPNYTVVAGDVGSAITVRYTVTDSATPTATIVSQSTAGVTPTAPIPTTDWNPGNDMNTRVPGTSSGLWSGASGTVTSTGCVVISTDGTNWSQSATVTSGTTTLYVQWNMASPGTCGLAPDDTLIQGTVVSGSNINSYSITIDRVPAAFGFGVGSANAALGSVQTWTPAATISGTNAAGYVTVGAFTGGGSAFEASINGGPFATVPSAPSTSMPIAPGQTITVRYTTNNTASASFSGSVKIGDADGVAATTSSPAFTVTNTSSTAFPGLTFSPVSGPNAAPETLSAVSGGGTLGTLNGTANSNAWPAGLGTTLSSPGVTPTLKFRKNGSGPFVTSGLAVNPTDVLNLAWNVAYLDTVATGDPATGTFQGTVGGTTYTNTFSFQVKKSPTFAVPTGVTGVTAGSTVNTGTMTVNGYNCPVTVSISAPTTSSTATMTAVKYTLSGVGPTTVSVPGSFTIYPSQTLLIEGKVNSTAGGFNGLTITIGSAAAQEWRVQNATAVPAIATPAITSPSGSPPALLNPALNSPPGITLQGNAYSASGGAGSQSASTWEVYKWVGGGSATAPTTSPPGANYAAIAGSPFSGTVQAGGVNPSVFVPQSALAVSSTYYARVRYSTTTPSAINSSYSNWSSFATAAAFVPATGAAYNGGYFGGQINDGGIIYNLIVGPVATAQNGGATPTAIQWKNANTADSFLGAKNEVYGFPMSQFGYTTGAATYPALHFSRTVTTGGYNDWYLPAKNELEVLYYFLKPDTTSNLTSMGSNANAVAPEPVSTNYTASNPSQTTATLFQGTNAQAFSVTGGYGYWSSSEDITGTSLAWGQFFTSGNQNDRTKANLFYARAIRREYANAPVAIGAAYGGGFFAGQYQDGVITYNLIVAPLTSGSLQGQYGGLTPTAIVWKNANTGDTNPPSQNAVCGKNATDTFGALGAATYPMFAWCYNDATGPNGNRTPGAGIGGFTDWYIPSTNEAYLLDLNLGPNWTTAGDFKSGTGAQAFSTVTRYWTATETLTDVTSADVLFFASLTQSNNQKASSGLGLARAVRRVVA